MDILTFVSTLITALAWPFVVVIVALLLRKPMAELIPLIRLIKFKEFELEFCKQVADIKADIAKLVITNMMPVWAFRHLSGIAILDEYKYHQQELFQKECEHLRDYGYIKHKDGHHLTFDKTIDEQNLVEFVEATDRGREYIRERCYDIPKEWFSKENLTPVYQGKLRKLRLKIAADGTLTLED